MCAVDVGQLVRRTVPALLGLAERVSKIRSSVAGNLSNFVDFVALPGLVVGFDLDGYRIVVHNGGEVCVINDDGSYRCPLVGDDPASVASILHRLADCYYTLAVFLASSVVGGRDRELVVDWATELASLGAVLDPDLLATLGHLSEHLRPRIYRLDPPPSESYLTPIIVSTESLWPDRLAVVDDEEVQDVYFWCGEWTCRLSLRYRNTPLVIDVELGADRLLRVEPHIVRRAGRADPDEIGRAVSSWRTTAERTLSKLAEESNKIGKVSREWLKHLSWIRTEVNPR